MHEDEAKNLIEMQDGQCPDPSGFGLMEACQASNVVYTLRLDCQTLD